MTSSPPSATGIEQDPAPEPAAASPNSFSVPGRHFRLTAVHLQDGSDLADGLVQERVWLLHPNEPLRLQGNLFCIEALDTGRQTLFILPEPLPHARPKPAQSDLRAALGRYRNLRIELSDGPWVLLDCGGGALARARALQDWQRSLRPATAEHRRPAFLSNTWGDRSRDSRMNQAFMEAEIEAAARLGVDVVQLDDGWQKGITSNSVRAAEGGVWEGFWNADPGFWTPHPERFPSGLEPLAALAREKGLRIGLWFAPDSWRDFMHWQRDADVILDLHHRLDVRNVKIDGIKIHSETAMANLRKFTARVLEGSEGRVAFDLDVTAETRPGPFGLISCGPLFIENRYTDWVTYWPHHTLRTLWQLTRWVDPLRLRMEFLNPERNPSLYGDDPLAPAAYKADMLFATVMAANPLGWFEVTGLSDPFKHALQSLVTVWKEHRARMADCTVLPVGDCPDGFNFSGFLFVPREADAPAYLLLFRGNTPDPEGRMTLPVPFPGRWCRLAGEGSLETDERELRFTIPAPRRYLFACSQAKSLQL